MRRPGRRDRRRRAAAAQGDRPDRAGRHRPQEVRHRLHQRLAARKEDGPVQAVQVVLLVGATWTAARRSTTSRSARTASTTVRSPLSPSPSAAASAPSSTPRCSTTPNRPRSRHSSTTSWPWASTGSRSPPATPMSARPTSSTSSTAPRPRNCSAASSAARAKGTWKKKWSFNQSSMFLDFLAGNQTFHCTPWGNPTRTYFGWQRPCYLLGEGYAKSFKELMGNHRLGPVRHRQLREMRRLHGALGL